MTPDAEALRALFATNRHWSEVATIAVFVGLLGDILVIFLFSKDKPKAETWLAFVCTLVIAGGVYGEYTFGGKAAQAADQLQRISDGRVADLNKEAGAARLKAGEADERSKKLEGSNKKLGIDLEAEKQRTASAETRLTDEQAKLQVALQATAKAQKDALDVQTKVNGSFLHRLLDRHVDIRLREFMKTLPPTRAEVVTIDSDTEAVVFAYEIRAALVESGWTVPPVVPVKKTPELSGVTITNRDIGAFFPFSAQMPPDSVIGLLGADGKSVDTRLAILVSALQVRDLTKDGLFIINGGSPG